MIDFRVRNRKNPAADTPPFVIILVYALREEHASLVDDSHRFCRVWFHRALLGLVIII